MTEDKIKTLIEWFKVRKGKTLKLNDKGIDFVVQALEEIQQYRAIGTIDELKALKEKSVAKKPDYEGDGYYNGEIVLDTWICPNCEKHYEVDYDDYEYCPNCGKHIDHSRLTEDD